MTAGHVLDGIRDSGKTGVVVAVPPGEGAPLALRVADMERLEHDIGILRVPGVQRIPPEWVYTLRWHREPVVQLDPVWTLGFAFGTHTVGAQIRMLHRAFRGYIVSDPPEFEIPQIGPRRFSAYELSFAAPRGLSGSPLLVGTGTHLPDIGVTGIVVGNSESRMLVFSSKETESESKSSNTTIVERYESLSLGIAIQVGSIISQNSELLAMNVGEYLTSHGILVAT